MNTRWHSGFLTVLLVTTVSVLAGCGGSDSATGPDDEGPTYNNISGDYAGILAGTSQGVQIDAQFSLSITQNGGDLGGSYAISGTLTDGNDTASIQGTGTLSGSIAAGNNPSVNLTVTPGPCPNLSANFSGSYDTSNSRLTISGPVYIFNNACEIVLTYQSTIVLSR